MTDNSTYVHIMYYSVLTSILFLGASPPFFLVDSVISFFRQTLLLPDIYTDFSHTFVVMYILAHLVVQTPLSLYNVTITAVFQSSGTSPFSKALLQFPDLVYH